MVSKKSSVINIKLKVLHKKQSNPGFYPGFDFKMYCILIRLFIFLFYSVPACKLHSVVLVQNNCCDLDLRPDLQV